VSIHLKKKKDEKEDHVENTKTMPINTNKGKQPTKHKNHHQKRERTCSSSFSSSSSGWSLLNRKKGKKAVRT
jgi:hypothetical protein